ncbi:HAD family hydrolase [bacterium]|nr:HAD family hydrolase [bacterium]
MADNYLIKGVIFDLDGTLLNTLADLAHSANKMLSEYGHATHKIDLYKKFVGHGIEELVKRALPESHRSYDYIKECTDRFQAIYSTTWNVDSQLYPGIPDLLDSIQQLNLPMAVLTNKPHLLALDCIDEFLSDWQLDPILGQRNGVPVKPDPMGAYEILNRWSLNPGDVVMMGDSGVDMRTAVNTGMIPVGVTWGFRNEDELQNAGALHLLNNPTDLLELFKFSNRNGV